MTNDWSFVWTPQFLIGTVIAGLVLNILAAYVVRALDHVRKALPASIRRARDAETARIEQLATAATSDNALYAALAAEASRLRLHQLLRFFIAFVCISAVMLLLTLAVLKSALGAVGVLAIVFLMVAAGSYYSLGLDSGKRARRLDIALSSVHRNRKLPIMD